MRLGIQRDKYYNRKIMQGKHLFQIIGHWVRDDHVQRAANLSQSETCDCNYLYLTRGGAVDEIVMMVSILEYTYSSEQHNKNIAHSRKGGRKALGRCIIGKFIAGEA